MRNQLLNYEEINKKLREQLLKTEKENEILRGNQKNGNLSYELESKNTTRLFYNNQGQASTSRSSYHGVSLNTSMSERSRSNHSSTPKTKMKINWEEIIPGQIPDRRKVFL